MKKIQIMTMVAITSITFFGCSKNENQTIKEEKKSDELIKRINDTKEICSSMKLELIKMKKKIDSNEQARSVSDYEYRRQLPDLYLKHSAEFLKVCGIHQ
jgi:hypothetical protein